MKLLFVPILALAGQMVTMQPKDIVHLAPHSDAIDVKFAGKLVELINAPPTVYLVSPLPKPDADGKLWTVDIKNLGPRTVTLANRNALSRVLQIGETVHVTSNGTSYVIRP